MRRALFTFILCAGCVSFAHAEGRSVAQMCSDYLLLARPRFGRPSATFENFDIRIASQWGRTSAGEARDLTDRYAEMIARLRAKQDALGFSSSQFLQVIVEAHPAAVRSPVTDSVAYGSNGNYQIPGPFGAHTLFIGREALEPARLETWPRTLFLSTSTSEAIVAHELAHLSEKPTSSGSRMWREARCDTISYLSTGVSDLETANEAPRWRFAEDGSVYQVTGKLIRSLSRPEIRNVSDIIPTHAAYHDNSQILSSLLFRMARVFGDDSVVRFLRWMDDQGQLITQSATPSTEPRIARQEIRTTVLEFFSAINNWAATSGRLDISAWLGEEMRPVFNRP